MFDGPRWRGVCYKLEGVVPPLTQLSHRRMEQPPARGNTTDVALACGLAIIRVINDSRGPENRGGRLAGKKGTVCFFMGSAKKAPER